MANKDPSRTEPPTEKRIEEARREGNVLQSQDLTAVSVLLVGFVMLFFITGPMFVQTFENMLQRVLEIDGRSRWNLEEFHHGVITGAIMLAKVLGPFMFTMVLAIVIALKLQIGHYFEAEPLKWKLDQMNPVNGLKQIAPSLKNIVKMLLAFAKILIIGFFIYLSIRAEMDTMARLPLIPLVDGIKYIFNQSALLIIKILVMFLVIAIIDYLFQRKKYMDDLMMTKQEVKDENKMKEGDPQVKSQIRSKMQEMSQNRMGQDVSSSDVVVTNPAHVAIALKYSTSQPAPKVMAKGIRKRAHYIKRLANEADVPVMESPALARSLYRHVKIGDFIPEQFFAAVAAILAKLQQSGKKDFMSEENNENISDAQAEPAKG